MAMDFYRLQVRDFSRVSKRHTVDSKYWKKLSFPTVIKEYGAVNHVDICLTSPHDIVATSSSRVQIYSSSTHQVIKSFSRFKGGVFSGSFRRDGKLIITGEANGHVQLFDVHSRCLLREFQEHSNAVHVAKFLVDGLHAVSGSDDTSVRCWDISTGYNVAVFKEHQDYVRCCVSSQNSRDVFITGCYDHRIKVWDMRCQSSTLTMDHGSPVECVQIFPSGGICLSAGSNMIKVWDLLGGGRLLTGFSNHQKTITSISLDGEHRHLFSGSLDRHVKIYDIQDYTVVHSMEYPSPILSLGVSPDNTHIVAGMSNGFLSVKYRLNQDVKGQVTTNRKLTAGTYPFFLHGKSSRSQEGGVVLSAPRKTKMLEYDKLLKKFDYSKALDSVLRKPSGGHASLLSSLLQELIRRKGLRTALSGRDEEGLVPLLRFLIRYINNPHFTVVLTDVADTVLDIYAPVVGQSERVDQLLMKLRNKLEVEINFHQKGFELLGTLDTLFATAHSSGGIR
ncbi:unnamed protein product [Porites lobata]|uniref:U3 small nucleolar RNA-associated protein 15 homolog n=1 Tax=Porites lobata TaxID=104759 RepID=A0ABN8QF32_9CNID|nr:unnamed protein product [Porites lobata]